MQSSKHTSQKSSASIIGAGLSGSLMALYLAQRGVETNVYEYRDDIRTCEVGGGKSINLALSERGLNALKQVGLEDTIREMCIPMHGRMIHSPSGKTELQPYGQKGQYINSISRQGLNQVLIDHAAKFPHVNFHFEHKCHEVDIDQGVAYLEDLHTGSRVETSSEVLIGADGAYSAVRQQLQKRPLFDFEQQYLTHGYKELTIPASDTGDFLLFANALHIWPRHDFMLIALPNLDRTFTVTLFLPHKGEENSFEALDSTEKLEIFFKREFPDAFELMPTLAEDFFDNPTGTLVTIRCNPYHAGKNIMLIGDAAHAVVPFYGQGMNAAFEDCFLLDGLIEKHNADWSKILPEFSESRKPDADAISHLALYNYYEMRSRVASPAYIWRKRLDSVLHKIFADAWMPLYTMVTFTTLPYSEARRRAQKQDKIVHTAFSALFSLILVVFFIVLFTL